METLRKLSTVDLYTFTEMAVGKKLKKTLKKNKRIGMRRRTGARAPADELLIGFTCAFAGPLQIQSRVLWFLRVKISNYEKSILFLEGGGDLWVRIL